MKIIKTEIPGLLVVEPQVFEDGRGWFMEAHNAARFSELGLEPVVTQINHSFSKKGVLRGLHFQAPPHDQTKLVRCLSGRLFDAAVDIRKGSPTYGRWFGLELSAENKRMLFVPSGFAHGFYAVTKCELMYLCGNSGYDKLSEGGLNYDDSQVGIEWPLDGEPLVNPRDASFPRIGELDSPFVFNQAEEKI